MTVFEAKTIDEETRDICNSFDAAITPYTIHRNDNNKIFLVLKSIAAGFSKIRDIVLALKYRFDPRYCDDDDLESAMYITGETRIPGKASIVRIVISNIDDKDGHILSAGTYLYSAPGGQMFECLLPDDLFIGALGFQVLLFASRNIGSWLVTGQVSASVVRIDGEKITTFFAFESLENSGSLGRMPETNFEVRQRILTDTNRQDTLRELELALSAIPSIFACNLIFNPDNVSPMTLEDGTVLLPKELLIIITGVPDVSFASVVMSHTFYKTHMNKPEEVVWYDHPLLAGGRYPVYYMQHKKRPFYMTINYSFDRSKIKDTQCNAALSAIFQKYKYMTQHIDQINEPLLYRDVENHNIPTVSIKKIYIQTMIEGSLVSVALVDIPLLMIPELIDIQFIPEEI